MVDKEPVNEDCDQNLETAKNACKCTTLTTRPKLWATIVGTIAEPETAMRTRLRKFQLLTNAQGPEVVCVQVLLNLSVAVQLQLQRKRANHSRLRLVGIGLQFGQIEDSWAQM